MLIAVGIFVVVASIVVIADLNRDAQELQKVASEPVISISPTSAASLSARMLPNVTLTVPETPGNPKITLVNGKGEYNQNGYQAWITMLPQYAEHQTSQGNDLFGIYTVNYGGSGTFYYVGLFENTSDGVSQRGALLLGNQLQITSLKLLEDPSGAADYELLINFRELGPSQVNAETPNTPATKIIKIKDHKFLPQ